VKVSIRNLGAIEEANIDLKPLTVLIGPNNAGKTWIAYALAGILGSYGSTEFIHAYTDKIGSHIYEQLDNAIEGVLTEGNATIDLRKFADEFGEMYFNDVAQNAQKWMNKYLSTQFANFDDMNISLRLEDTKTYFLQRISLYSRINRVAESVLTIRKNRGEDKIYAFTSTEVQEAERQEETLGEKIPLQEVRERLISFVSRALHQSLFPQIHIFPTERTTLVASRFSGNIAERVQPRINERFKEILEVLAKELTEQNIATRETIRPVSAFMGMLNIIFRMRKQDMEERERRAEKDPAIKRYIELAEVMENHILAGGVYFSTPEPDPRREVLFQPLHDVNLEIPIASSMVKELAPLVLYLRYLARSGELLIIDEPEMNLHPVAQVKIIEFLSMLVNAGLRVLITTHSTYVVDHLTNLIEAAKHANQDAIEEKFLLEQKEAFIAPENVSVYLVEDGKAKDVLTPQGTIDWKTFSDVTAYVNRVHFELLGE
jgi:predicted ATP-dependent endonuclease of OLD family